MTKNGTKVKAIVTGGKIGVGVGRRVWVSRRAISFVLLNRKEKKKKREPLSGRVHDEDLKYIESQGFA